MSDLPAPPAPLAGPALAKWRELVTAHQWRPTQLAHLAAYCAAFGRWAEAERWLADPTHGPVLTIRDDKGNVKSHGPAPQLTIAERSAKEMDRLAAVLRLHVVVDGTTPALPADEEGTDGT